ncbi:hypothetical protein HYX58_02090 [Candidatus Dependentiae bacterium]|nr:hypothetical protein [Candidatus Dependentiae bacterium]
MILKSNALKFYICLIIPSLIYAEIADEQVAMQLFDSVKAAEKRGYSFTQSQAQLSVPRIQQKVRSLEKLAQNKKIIDECFRKEMDMKNTHYVFYTAVPYLRLFQDITRKLYKRKVGNIGALSQKSFQFIRYTYNDPIYGQYKDVTDFLIQEIQENGMVDDNLTRLKTILVSTNLAFFGNIGFTGESTYYYLNHPQPWARAKREWLDASLKSFGYSTAFSNELLALQDLTKTGMGDLFQLFIPKEMVNSIGYLSWRQGIPFDVPFISAIFQRPNLSLSRADQIYPDEINKLINEIKKNWKEKDPATVTLVNNLLESVRAGKFHLDEFLQTYKKAPAALPFLNYYQARLLVTNDQLLNPSSGIIIYRYSSMDPQKEQEYKAKLNGILEKMEDSKKVPDTSFAEKLENLKNSLNRLTARITATP